MLADLKACWYIIKFILTHRVYFIQVNDFDNRDFITVSKGLGPLDVDHINQVYEKILTEIYKEALEENNG